jgi:hypothetical protein
MRRRVYLAYGTCWGAIVASFFLVYQLPITGGWQLFAWSGFSLSAFILLDRMARCPYCGVRLIREGVKPDFDRFAYIRCQSCRRRFDGREGPDPEISDEMLAGGDPTLLAANRETSAQTALSLQALTDPRARRARLAELEADIRGWEDELRRHESRDGIKIEEDVAGFVRNSLEQARREMAELRRLDDRAIPPSSGRA